MPKSEQQPASDSLRPETRSLITSRPLSERKELGQYFTPRLLRETVYASLPLFDGASILEPAVGTGEFLADLHERFPNARLTGWDIDPIAIDVAKKLVGTARLEVKSALDGAFRESYDFVISNPPYFEMPKLPKEERERFTAVISGRPNIFALFFLAGLKRVRPGGYLAYVVPPSMNSGKQFESLRSYILSQGDVEFLKVFTDPSMFEDAQTAVQVITVRKRKVDEPPSRSRFVLDVGKLAGAPKARTVFTEHKTQICKDFKNNSTLWQLGYQAVTGTTVWNEHKDALRDTPNASTVPLVWSHNITDKRKIDLSVKKAGKPQFVEGARTMMGPAIAVGRVVGSVGSGMLRCAVIPRGMTFASENHVNVIRPRDGVTPLVSIDELLTLLRDPGVNQRVQRLTGNTQVGSVELTHFLTVNSLDRVK